MSQTRPVFFLVGVARSGTTLLRIMLDRHPEVTIPPESHFIPRLYARRDRYGANGTVDRPELLLGDLAADRWFRRWELPVEEVREELSGARRPTLVEALSAAHRAYARRSGKPRWGDKTPRYIEHLPLLGRLFPEARFVHMIRDGRDVALSLLDRDQTHRTAASPAYMWSRRILRGRQAARALEGRYVEVHYEHLLDDQEAVLRSLCTFLHLPFDPVMLHHDGRAFERIPSVIIRLHGGLALPPTRGLRDWRTQMGASALAEFEAIAGPVLTATGYERAARPTLRARLGAWGRVLTWSLRRAQRLRRGLGGGRSPRAGADQGPEIF